MSIKRDAKWYRFYYRFQEMLSQDKWYMETIQETREGTGNGVRQESSLPFALNTLASEMADIECTKPYFVTDDEEAYFKWRGYSAHPSVIELRSPAKVVLSAEEIVKLLSDGIDKQAKKIDELRIETIKESVHTYNTVSTSKGDYHFYLNSLSDDLRAMLDENVQADNYYLVTNWVDVVIGGFATNKNGYLTGLFSYIRGNGKRIFEMRLAQAKLDAEGMTGQYSLFCTGPKLKEFYAEQGFLVESVHDWDDNLAPRNWNYERFGKPNLYWMTKDIH